MKATTTRIKRTVKNDHTPHAEELHPVLGVQTDVLAREAIDAVLAMPGATPNFSCGGSVHCTACDHNRCSCWGYISFEGTQLHWDALEIALNIADGEYGVLLESPANKENQIVVRWSPHGDFSKKVSDALWLVANSIR